MPAAPPPDDRPSRTHRRSSRYAKEAKALGLRVRSLRLAEGLTLEQVGERCALDWKHLQKIERGSVNLTLVTLVRLAVGLGVELHVLFAPDPSMPSPKPRPAKKRGFVVASRS